MIKIGLVCCSRGGFSRTSSTARPEELLRQGAHGVANLHTRKYTQERETLEKQKMLRVRARSCPAHRFTFRVGPGNQNLHMQL